jgi:transposase
MKTDENDAIHPRIQVGISSIPIVAELKKVSKQRLYDWLELYSKFGEEGLENKNPGAPPLNINKKFEELILKEWNLRKRSAHKLWIDLKMKGYSVSERQIQKIYRKHGFVMK